MKILIAGATGLVGGELLKAVFLNPAFTEVVILSRREIMGLPAKARVVVTELGENWLKPLEGSVFDAVFCALGTTLKKAGSEEAFREVDERAILKLASFTEASGSKQFLLVSSIGADPKSQSFYLRIKGGVEKAVEKLSIPSITIVRPSIILGDRKEHRPMEELGKEIFKIFTPLLILHLKKYRGIEARDIARTMAAISLDARSGVRKLESDAIQGYSHVRPMVDQDGKS